MKVARAGAVVGRVGLPHGVEADIPGLFYRNVGLRGGPAPVRTYDLQRLLKEVLDGNINPASSTPPNTRSTIFRKRTRPWTSAAP